MNNDHLLSPEELAALLQDDQEEKNQEQAALKLKLVLDFPLEISVRLGNAQRTIGELLNLHTGAVIELDRMVTEPEELLVTGKHFARGEVITIGENFGVNITAIVKPEERVKNLR